MRHPPSHNATATTALLLLPHFSRPPHRPTLTALNTAVILHRGCYIKNSIHQRLLSSKLAAPVKGIVNLVQESGAAAWYVQTCGMFRANETSAGVHHQGMCSRQGHQCHAQARLNLSTSSTYGEGWGSWPAANWNLGLYVYIYFPNIGFIYVSTFIWWCPWLYKMWTEACVS
jgi:hypothetical protein